MPHKGAMRRKANPFLGQRTKRISFMQRKKENPLAKLICIYYIYGDLSNIHSNEKYHPYLYTYIHYCGVFLRLINRSK